MRASSAHARRAAAMPGAFALSLLSACLLVACGASEESAPPDAAMPSSDTAPVQPPPSTTDAPVAPVADAAGGTVGGDGSQIQLDPLTGADLTDAGLVGELACSFSEGAGAPLLLAHGDVGSQDAAQGVVKVAGYVEAIRAPGGFDGLTRNPVFSGQGKTITIEETGPATGGGESPPRPATLTYQRADGASRTIAGQWQCGP